MKLNLKLKVETAEAAALVARSAIAEAQAVVPAALVQLSLPTLNAKCR